MTTFLEIMSFASIGVLLSVLALIFKRSKVLAVLFLVLMWLLWGWNTDNGDYYNYELTYRYVVYLFQSDYEIGFKFLMFGGELLGLSYQQFLQVLSLIILLLWSNVIFRLTDYPALALTIVFWIFFPIDYVQLRNTLAFAIVMQGLLCWIKFPRYGVIAFALTVLLASTIHSSSIFYLSFVILYFIKDWSLYRILAIATVIGVLALGLRSVIFNHLTIQTEGRTEYYTSSAALTIIYTFIQLVNACICIKIYEYVEDEGMDSSLFKLVAGFNILLMLLIPLYSTTAIVVRLFRNLILFDTLFYVNLLVDRDTPRQYAVYGVALLCIVFIHFVGPVTEYTIEPLFTENLLLYSR
ncbi:MAG: EpsG family protein [Muribaculaceae bacterium]|nr:EpsG family protein [Muribaculaceae bacterium]